MDLYTNKNLILESNCEVEDAKFVLLGIPFDSTSTYRTGSRFAPLEIRKEFLELEKESGKKSFFDVKFCDLGNIEVVHGNLQKTFERVVHTMQNTFKKNENFVPIVLGGEHTLTYPILKILNERKKISMLHLDAHLDLRDDYLGEKWNHSTVMRRVSELGVKITSMGVRSMSNEESKFAKEKGMDYCGVDVTKIKKLLKKTKGKNLYITLDMDVLDPSVAPGVSNPEPNGISLNTLIEIINVSKKQNNIVGFDIMEVNPLFDNGATTVTAAKLLLDFMLLK